jgi:hypothetical protein
MVFGMVVRNMNSMSSEPEKKDDSQPASPSGESKPAETPKSAGGTVAAKGPMPNKPPGPPRKKWDPKPPTMGDKVSWHLVVVATALALLVVLALLWLMMRTKAEPGGPKLGDEYRDPVNNYSIHPPYNWRLEDPHDGYNFFIVGPRERGFSPLIMICVDVQPGELDEYLKDYKSLTQFKEKTLQFTSDARDRVDKTECARLEYDCDLQTDDGKTVKIHSLQYIIPDPPRFYRITCSVRGELFPNYLTRFEAAARSFKRLPPTTQTVPRMAPAK